MELLISIKYSYSYVRFKVQAGAGYIGYYLKCIPYGPMGYNIGR